MAGIGMESITEILTGCKQSRSSGVKRPTRAVVYEYVGFTMTDVIEPAGTKLAELGHCIG